MITEGAVKNEQSRDTDNNGHKTQNKDKQNRSWKYDFVLKYLSIRVVLDKISRTRLQTWRHSRIDFKFVRDSIVYFRNNYHTGLLE
jgi:hypothetical protein